jgi:hypothetical protein
VTGVEPLGPNPVTLLIRQVLAERARRSFPPGARVLDFSDGAVEAGATFDAAYAAPGAWDGRDLGVSGRTLAAALRPGSPVLLCLTRRRPEGRPLGLREAGQRLGSDFTWRGGFGLGVLIPGESRQEWARGHPQAFGLLAALESVVRRWPLLRGLGDYIAIEGSRR